MGQSDWPVVERSDTTGHHAVTVNCRWKGRSNDARNAPASEALRLLTWRIILDVNERRDGVGVSQVDDISCAWKQQQVKSTSELDDSVHNWGESRFRDR